MKNNWLVWMCCGWLLVTQAWSQAVDPLPFKDRAQEERFQTLTHELRCVQCQNNSLADSDGMIARDVRHEVFRLMQEGLSDEQIKEFLVDRYGDFILFKPRFDLLNSPLWLGPALLLVAGAIAGILMFKRRAALAGRQAVSQEERG